MTSPAYNIAELFAAEEWLSTDDIYVAHQQNPNQHSIVSEWLVQKLIFSVTYEGKEYFARYQFDMECYPLPVIAEILTQFGPAEDSWKIAAWLHYPNGYIVSESPSGASPLAPKDVLHRQEDVLRALRNRRGTYIA